jgi:hypothetical protein
MQPKSRKYKVTTRTNKGTRAGTNQTPKMKSAQAGPTKQNNQATRVKQAQRARAQPGTRPTRPRGKSLPELDRGSEKGQWLLGSAVRRRQRFGKGPNRQPRGCKLGSEERKQVRRVERFSPEERGRGSALNERQQRRSKGIRVKERAPLCLRPSERKRREMWLSVGVEL